MGRIPKRYCIAILAFFGTTFLYLLHTNVIHCFNFNGKLNKPRDILLAEITHLVGLAFSCFAGILVVRYGGAFVFAIAMLFSAVVNLLTDFALNQSYLWFVLLRFVDGIFQAYAYCALPDLWSRWSPPRERSRLMTFSFSGIYFSAIVDQALSNFVQRKYIFYIVGIAAFLWSIIWFLYVRNDPADDKYLSKNEKKHLMKNSDILDRERDDVCTYPWKSILISKSLWILCITGLIFEIGVTYSKFLTLCIPDCNFFIGQVINFYQYFSISVESFFFWSILPFYFLFGYLADYVKRIKDYTSTQIRTLYICFGFLIGAASLAAEFYAQLDIVIFYLLFQLARALVETAFLVNVIDLSPRYSSLLYGIQKTFSTVGYLITILFVEKFAIRDEHGWSVCFNLISALYVLSGVLYYLWGSSELQSWNNTPNEEYELKRQRSRV